MVNYSKKEGGYLYADLLVALMIISILAAALFAAAVNLNKNYYSEWESAHKAMVEFNENQDP